MTKCQQLIFQHNDLAFSKILALTMYVLAECIRLNFTTETWTKVEQY